MNLRKRIPQWTQSVRREHGRGARIPWLGMIRALLSGPVPKAVFMHRLSVCRKCPVFDRKRLVCRSTLPGYEYAGCGCLLQFSALAAAPYPRGCWLAEATDGRGGWPAYVWPSRWAKLRSTLYFLIGRRY
jgi:hypothetical protein